VPWSAGVVLRNFGGFEQRTLRCYFVALGLKLWLLIFDVTALVCGYASGQVILSRSAVPRMLVSASLHRGHMDTSGIELPSRRTRRRHASEFRDQVVRACRQPGVSIAAVALANGLNADMVRKWVSDAEARSGQTPASEPGRPALANGKPMSSASAAFVQLALPAPAAPAPVDEIRVELQRGAIAVKVAWPSTAAAECADWLRELLR
jgi:transposase-like protein